MKETQIKLESLHENLKPLREKLGVFLKTAGLPEETRRQISVVLGEAFTNAIRHAYEGRPGQEIQITFEDHPEKVVLKVRDFGRKIDLSKVKTPELPPQRPGGLGIYFMKTIMDELKYNTAHPEGNELILVKYKKKREEEHENQR